MCGAKAGPCGPIPAVDLNPVCGGPYNLGELKEQLLTDTIAQLQGSSGVHAWTAQGCFGSEMGADTVLGRWS